MSKSGDLLGVSMSIIVLTSIRNNTRFSASGILSYNTVVVIVTKRSYNVNVIAVATNRTSVSCASVAKACGRYFVCYVIVSVSEDFLGISMTAVILTGEGHYTAFGTSRSLRYHSIVKVVAKRTDNVGNIAMTAN